MRGGRRPCQENNSIQMPGHFFLLLRGITQSIELNYNLAFQDDFYLKRGWPRQPTVLWPYGEDVEDAIENRGSPNYDEYLIRQISLR